MNAFFQAGKKPGHSERVFAHFGYRGDQGESWETPYEKLARMPKPEDWDFHRSQFKRNGQAYPILTSYLNYTFLRLQELDRSRLRLTTRVRVSIPGCGRRMRRISM